MSKIKTKRLNLRYPILSDAKFHANGLGDYQVAKNLLVPHPYNIEMAHEWLAQDFTNKTINETRFVVEKKDNILIGGIGFNDKNNEAVLSYWIAKEFWGLRYASEAVLAIITWYFKNSKAKQILSGAFHFNKASLKIQQRLGFIETARSTLFCPARNIAVENIETKLNKKTFLGLRIK